MGATSRLRKNQMNKVNPEEIKFIKLGRSGGWESQCIESKNPMIRLGFDNPYHQECLDGQWEVIKKHWAITKTKGKATEITNVIKDFYTLSPTTMWITFFHRKLFWCFASQEVILLEDGSRIRKVIGKWNSTDIKGNELFVESLSGKLAKVQMYQGTMCSVKEREYLVNKINTKTLPEVTEARDCFEKLNTSLKPLIKNLSWQDFELLIDLIFSNAGWQRIATLGKVEKSIDLDIMSPVTGKRAFVQVKAQSTPKEFESYINQFMSMDQYDEMYYVSHTDTLPLNKVKLPNNVMLMDVNHLSGLVINSGLVSWLIQKTS